MVVAVGITSEAVKPGAGTAASIRSARGPGLLTCLVLSGDRGLRNRLDAVMELSGWSACDAPEQSSDLQAVVDGDYQLVVVDVAHPLGDRVSDTVEIAEDIASRPGSLLVVCGSVGNVDEELWARQMGAWVYLPGVSGGDALVSLFTEARRLAERRGEAQPVA